VVPVSALYVIAQDHHDGFLILSTGTAVLAFESVFEAQDYSDTLDEPGEFEVIPYDPTMGPAVVVI
jgi:hypothetical protein